MPEYVATAEMKKIRAVQLGLIEELQRVCGKYGLKFWLDSGSLLGAIRHKGYIPWDDDIDVCMFRSDYDRLAEVAGNEFKHPVLFQTAYTEKHFVRGHAQMRNTETTAIIPIEIYKDFNQGIFIDIFILDGVSDDGEKVSDQKRRAAYLREKLELLAMPLRYIDCRNDRKRWMRSLRYKLRYPSLRAKGRLYKRYEDIFRETLPEVCSYVDKSAFLLKFRKIGKHIYDGTVYMDFEHLRLPVPSGYDELLTIYYGDYMKPVIEPTMHGEVIFDADIPADMKIKELRRKK